MQSNTKQQLFQGLIYTCNSKQAFAEAMLIDNGEITFVGELSEAKQKANSDVEIIKAPENGLILPGFIDSHIHPTIACLRYFGCYLGEADSYEEVTKRIKTYITENPTKEWILCHGYFDKDFPNSTPNRHCLDAICDTKPIIMQRTNLHKIVLNTKALEMCNITKDTQMPTEEEVRKSGLDFDLSGLWHEWAPGVIQKDENGELTGVLYDAAFFLLKPNVPRECFDFVEQAFLKANKMLLDEGITTYLDACLKPYLYNVFDKYYNSDDKEVIQKLPRTAICIAWTRELEEGLKSNPKSSLSEVAKIRETKKLRCNSIKFFVDGVIQDGTALISGHYCCGGTHKLQMFKEEEIKEASILSHQRGIQCHYHAIGDVAIHMALDSIEAALQSKPDSNEPDRRHFISHNQMLDDKDLPRYAKMNVSANYTPLWFDVLEAYRITNKPRSEYNNKDLADSGARVVYGSDWPVSSHRVLDEMECVVTRRGLGQDPKDYKILHEDQCMSIEDAIKGYTIDGAYVVGMDHLVGSIEVGKRADIVILDQNVLNIQSNSIHKVKVLETYLDGKRVFKKE